MAPAPRFSPAEEESIVLNAAAKCIRESSLLDFKMSSIASEAGISMGSIYKHVRSKEDVLVALSTKVLSFSQNIFAEILALPISVPERLISTVLLDPMKIYEEPFGAHLEMLISNEAMLSRASPRWLEKLDQLDHNMERIFFETIQASDELNVGEEKKEELIEGLMLGLWSIHVGFLQVALHRSARRLGEPENALPFPLPVSHRLVSHAHVLINTYDWTTPLTIKGIEKTASELTSLNYR